MSSSSGGDRARRDDQPDGSAHTAAVEIDERAIDRKLLAQLIARHGAPRAAPPPSADEEERRQIVARRDRAMAAADPSWIRYIERHERTSARLTYTQRAALAMRTVPAFRSHEWDALGLREIGEVRELEVNEELRAAMEHRTPQAFLRDLHRPVQFFGDVELRRTLSPTAGSALALAQAMVSQAVAHRAGEAGRIELSSRVAQCGLDELIAVLSRPWQESKPENPLPMPSRAPGGDDMHWFGLSGGYDPNL